MVIAMNPEKRHIVGLAITGASGVIYGFRLLEELVKRQTTVHFTLSPNAVAIAKMELGIDVDLQTGRYARMREDFFDWVTYHHYTHVGAAPASGSYPFEGIVVAPCSMGVLGRIANGISDTLVTRMADVALKERRPLIVVPRETPYNLIHLRNMKILCEAGATILPANPGFYHHPQSVDDMVNFVVARVLKHLGIDASDLVKGGWGEIDSIASQVYLEDI